MMDIIKSYITHMQWDLPGEFVQDLIAYIFAFMAAWFCFLTLRHFLPIKPGRWRKVLCYILMYFLVASIIYVGDPVNILAMVPLTLLAVLPFFEGSLTARLSLAMLFFCIIGGTNAVFDSAIPVSVGMLPLRALVWLALYLFVKKALPPHSALFASRLWVLLDVLGAMPLTILLTVVVFGDAETRWNKIPGQVIILLCCALASIALLVALVILANYTRLEEAVTLSGMRKQYYNQLEQHQTEVRRMRHDMANHLQTLATLEGPQAKEYLNELLDTPALYAGRRFCENEVVNAVLNAKYEAAKQCHIAWEHSVSIPQTLPVADTDLCALFANSLNNAIEACEKLPEAQRFVQVKARLGDDALVLEVKNAAAAAPKTARGRVVTSKADTLHHGFGLAGMREIAARYGGQCETEFKDNTFSILVTLLLVPSAAEK